MGLPRQVPPRYPDIHWTRAGLSGPAGRNEPTSWRKWGKNSAEPSPGLKSPFQKTLPEDTNLFSLCICHQIGMVAFKMKLKTREYPEGRDVIIISNDITFRIGSFGLQEDLLYLRASEMARAEGIPKIYLAANSGARIGLAEEIKHMFQVAWVNPEDPHKVCHEAGVVVWFHSASIVFLVWEVIVPTRGVERVLFLFIYKAQVSIQYINRHAVCQY